MNNTYIFGLLFLFSSNSFGSELFFKCDYSINSPSSSVIDDISVNTSNNSGTWTTNDKNLLPILEFNHGGTIMPLKVTMTADEMYLNRQSMFSKSWDSQFSINRSNLTYSDSLVTLGKCELIEKENKF